MNNKSFFFVAILLLSVARMHADIAENGEPELQDMSDSMSEQREEPTLSDDSELQNFEEPHEELDATKDGDHTNIDDNREFEPTQEILHVDEQEAASETHNDDQESIINAQPEPEVEQEEVVQDKHPVATHDELPTQLQDDITHENVRPAIHNLASHRGSLHATMPPQIMSKDDHWGSLLLKSVRKNDRGITQPDVLNNIERLLRYNANPNMRDEHGKTTLMYATDKGDLAMIDLLLKAGADVNAHDSYGRTARQIAEDKGLVDITKMLQNAEEIYQEQRKIMQKRLQAAMPSESNSSQNVHEISGLTH